VADPFGWREPDAADTVEPPVTGLGTGAWAGIAALVVVAVTAVLVAGAAGLLIALSALAAGAALVVALSVPGAPTRRRRRTPGPPVQDAPFRAYRQVAEQLSWAAVSPRHYDLVTRPLLVRLAASRLADRHRIDLYTEPRRSRDLLGMDVWPWVDPDREPSRNGQPPGVGATTLSRIIDRLERL